MPPIPLRVMTLRPPLDWNPVWILGCVLWFSSTLAAWAQDDLARLAHPDVAERLSLTDPQRTQIQQLLLTRAEAMAKAPDKAAKDSAQTAAVAQVMALLTEAQRTQFAALEPVQRLMFQFREMKWDDVLHWFAEQQGLTLVMDRTPPGSFTYSDSRSYSPSEGIDLLNSVLMTRNFALVRREKMLVVMELSDAIPLELIPRIKQEDLVQRGKFELVSVLFPLGGRPIESVLNEVKPYLSSYGRAVPLAQGGQLLVVENAGKMQTINELILSVPVPRAIPKPEPVPPPKPVFAAYALGTLDAASVLKTLQTLLPSDPMTIDPKTGVLSAQVIPDHHTTIKSAIDQMLASATELPGPISVAYQSSKPIPEDLKKQIFSIAPNAMVMTSLDRVLVSASASDQKLIETGLAGLDITPALDSPDMKVFEIEPAMATIAETAMKAFLPKAQVAANSKAGSLIVRGNEKDLKLAGEVFEIWKKSQTNQSLQIKAFPLDRVADAKWLTTVQKLVPNANTWLSTDGTQLMMLATPGEIASIEATLSSLLSLLPATSDRQLKIYSLTKDQAARRTLLSELPIGLTSMKIVDSTNKQELIAWGTPEQHIQFAEFLERLDEPAAAAKPAMPKLYPIEIQDAALVQSILAAEFPEAKLTLDTDGTKLTVVAEDASQLKIGERLALFQQQLPKRIQPTLESYSVAGMTAASLSTALTPLLAKARVNVDTAKNRLLITADTNTHREIADLVRALSENTTADQQKVVVVYPVQNATPTQIKTILDQLLLGNVILADDKLKQVVVTGTIESQASAKATIEQMDRPTAASGPKELRSYDTKKIQAAYLLPLLQKMWPDMQLAADATANKIIATGTPSELEALNQAMERMIAAPDGSPQTVRTYAVPAGDMLTLTTILGQIAPHAILSSDAISRTVTAWANEEQHARIEQALEQISKTAQAAKVPATYLVKPTQVTAVQTSLLTLFPTAGVAIVPTTGQIIVVASAEQQQRVAEVVDLLTSGPNAESRTIRVFRLDPERVDPVAMVAGLQAILPTQIRVEPNPTNQTLLVIGTPDELELVASKIDELQKQLPEPEASSTRVYPLRHGNTVSALTMLQSMLPKATIVQDAITRTLSATAKPKDHSRIEEFLKAFDAPREPATYLVKPGQAIAVQTSLKALFPYADVTSDPTTGQIIVVAEPSQQEQISQVVDMMGSGPNAAERTVRVFRIDPERAELTTILATLQSTLPSQIKLESNPRNQTLLAIGAPQELELVAKKIEEILAQLPEPEPITSIVYPLKHGTAAGAYAILTTLLPRATMVQDAVSRTIAATAKRGEHERIRELLATYDVPRLDGLETRVYRLKQGNAYGLATVLLSLMPQASVYGGRDDGILVATATLEQHQRIDEIVKGYEKDAVGIETRVFPIAVADVTTLRAALQASSTKITVTADVATNSLIATATAEDMKRIEQVVQDIDGAEREGRTTRYYGLATADPLPMSRSLVDSFPKAKFAADSINGGLFATATQVEHEAVSKIVEEVNAQPGKLPSLKAFPLKHASPEAVSKSITLALGPRTTTGVSFSRDAKSVFVVGAKQDLQTIEQIVQQMDQPMTQENLKRMEIFSLKGVDGKSLETSLTALFKDTASEGDIKFDPFNEQLLVTGDAARIAMVGDALKKLAPPPRELEIFQLDSLDPYSFKLAAESLFEDEPLNAAPSITIDSNQQQVLVRGTLEQMEKMKNLLIRMGESQAVQGTRTRSSANSTAEPTVGGSRLRFVPVNRNPSKLLEEVQRVWPLMRTNPIQVVDPKGLKQPAAPAAVDTGAVVPQQDPFRAEVVLGTGPTSRAFGSTSSIQTSPVRRLVSTQDPAPDAIGTNASQDPPIVIVTGDNQWTIASDDLEAVGAMERLLDSLLNPKVEPFATAGSFSVYILRHADAKQLRELLNELFRSGDGSRRSSTFEAIQRVKIVADTRINALVIGGNRADRKVIEELLGVFDSKDLIDRLQQITPTLVTLRSASAKNVADIVRDVYKSQLSAGAGRNPLDIPEGVSTEVATILQQINAQASGPLLTLSVDDSSNLIVLRGPPDLTEEVQSFIDNIDRQASDAPARRIQVLRLESTNSKNLEKALKMLYSK
jgi:type II secretory pathway component GspD/PulD (secretin)